MHDGLKRIIVLGKKSKKGKSVDTVDSRDQMNPWKVPERVI